MVLDLQELMRHTQGRIQGLSGVVIGCLLIWDKPGSTIHPTVNHTPHVRRYLTVLGFFTRLP